MGSHPVNLALRFLLEITALFFLGMWGWKQSNDWLRYMFAIGIPLVFATLWGTFAVPNDPSRSGKAPIATPGIIRLLIELFFFGCATWALYDMEFIRLSLIFGSITALHYLTSYDRILWLLSGKRDT